MKRWLSDNLWFNDNARALNNNSYYKSQLKSKWRELLLRHGANTKNTPRCLRCLSGLTTFFIEPIFLNG
jgi:hypothetical protein